MPNIFTPQQDEQFITPFSPVIGYKKLSPSFVEKLNNSMNDKLEDWSDTLVGKVKEELKFSDDIINFFIEEMKDFIMRYQLNTELYTSMGRTGLDPNSNYGISTTSGWFIRQFEGEYNPVHVHQGSLFTGLSSVMILKLPESYGPEYSAHDKPTNGRLQIMGNSTGQFANVDYGPKVEEGHFYIFPYDVRHAVYPFNGPGKRRTLSFNCDVDYDPIMNRSAI